MTHRIYWGALNLFRGSSGEEASIENEEFEIDIIEDASEGEHCYLCDSEFRTGWKAN